MNTRSGLRNRLRSPKFVFRIFVGIAASPILVAAVHRGLIGWVPTGDTAITTVRINDVLTAHPPLIGLPAAPAQNTGFTYAFPGALELYLLAVPVRVLGDAWGILLGMAAINTGAFVTALWLIRRRVGYAGGLVACVVWTSILWSIGPQMLIEPTPMRMGVIPFALFLVAAWSVARGDARALLPLTVVANYLFLDQLKFAVVVPLVTIVAVSLWTVQLRRIRDNDRARWPSERRRQGRWVLASAAFTVLVWIPPLVDQFTRPGGNLGELLRAFGTLSPHAGGATHRTLLGSLSVVVSPLTTWPLWFRSSFLHPNFDASGVTTPALVTWLGFMVVTTLLIIFCIGAYKRRDGTILTGFGIGIAAITGWTIASYLNPAVFSAYSRSYLFSLWPLSAFIWLMIVFGIMRTRRAQRRFQGPRRRATALAGVAAATLALAAAAMPIAHPDISAKWATVEPAHQLRGAILARIPPGGPVLVRQSTGSDDAAKAPNLTPLFPVALLALQDAGIPFRVTGPHDIRYFGSHRALRHDPLNATRELVLSSKPIDRTDVELIAHIRRDKASYDQPVGREIHRWATSLDHSRRAADRGEIGPLPGPLDSCVTRAHAEGTLITDSFPCVTWLLLQDDRQLTRLLPESDRSPDELRTWLTDQIGDLAVNGWVYLQPLNR